MEESTITATDGQSIYLRHWPATTEAKGILVLVHGFGEHPGRYQHVAQFLNEAGYTIFSHDQRGHGYTTGKRGHAVYPQVLQDIETVINHARSEFPDLPMVLYGQSWGGNLTANFLLTKSTITLKGAILGSPWLDLTHQPNAFMRTLGKVMSNIWPSITAPSNLDPSLFSHDPDVIKAYKEDPLVHNQISAGIYEQTVKAGKEAIERAGQLKLPILHYHGTDDEVTSFAASQQFANNAGDNLKFVALEGFYHETYNEPNKEVVLDLMVNWLNELVAS